MSFFPANPNLQVGCTMVFFRKAAFDDIEARRHRVLRRAAVQISAAARCFLVRKRYVAQRLLVVRLQAIVRGHRGRLVAAEMRRERAAVVVQAFLRRCHARMRFLRLRKSVVRLQSFKRGAVARARAALLHQALSHKRNAAVRIQGAVRCWHATVLLKRCRAEAARDTAFRRSVGPTFTFSILCATSARSDRIDSDDGHAAPAPRSHHRSSGSDHHGRGGASETHRPPAHGHRRSESASAVSRRGSVSGAGLGEDAVLARAPSANTAAMQSLLRSATDVTVAQQGVMAQERAVWAEELSAQLSATETELTRVTSSWQVRRRGYGLGEE